MMWNRLNACQKRAAIFVKLFSFINSKQGKFYKADTKAVSIYY